MLVNIATGMHSERKTLFDPFCGMGTIMAEALLLGCNVIGGDIESTVIEKARENLQWLKEEYRVRRGTITLHVLDAVHASNSVRHGSVDMIVTEPYMGPTAIAESTISALEIRNIFRGLEKLYIGALKNWREILVPGGGILMALPEYQDVTFQCGVKRVVDRCEKLGYNTHLGPIEYSRPQAKVKRMFYLFKKLS